MSAERAVVPSAELIHADCLEWMRTQPAAFVDCVVTSPPYNLGVDYSTHDDAQPREVYLAWMDEVFAAIRRILKPDGHFFLNVGYSNRDPTISFELAMLARRSFELQNRIVWTKSVHVDGATHGHFKPINSDRYVTPTNEDVFQFTKTGDARIDKLAIGVPYADKSNLNKRSRARGRIAKSMGFEGWRDFEARATEAQRAALEAELERRVAAIGEVQDQRCRGNTWFIPYDTIQDRSAQRGRHPATFPVALPAMCIALAGLPPGAIVFDPFVGTGTTLVAATERGMRGIGTDVDAEYLRFAAARARVAVRPAGRTEARSGEP